MKRQMTPITDDGGVYKSVVKKGTGELVSAGAICRGTSYLDCCKVSQFQQHTVLLRNVFIDGIFLCIFLDRIK